MNIDGINIDTEKLGCEFYTLIENMGDANIVAFGMLPAPFMRIVEDAITVKIRGIITRQHGLSEAEFKTWLSGREGEGMKLIAESIEQTVKAITKDAVHQVCVAIYAAANKQGKMVV